MISLFLSTATSYFRVAIVKEETVLIWKEEKVEKDLSEKLFLFLEQSLKEAEISLKEIQKIYVVIGPGSFTGVRLGVTFAKTLAWSLKIPIVPISTLEAFASSTDEYNTIVPVIDARRGYVYTGIYQKDLTTTLEDQYLLKDELLAKLSRNDNIIFITEDQFDHSSSIMFPKISVEKIISKYKNHLGQNPHTVSPNYLKNTEAEEKLQS